ncbi:MAG: ABC transporter permease [Candidatus Thorarchaeota archaeon]|nr:ABC transporter permease [Candidatus Thorarchaeota archaeon]
MSEHQMFASKDLKRRPFRTTLTIISLTSVVTATTFVFLFGNVLLDVSSFAVASALSSSFGTFFSTFVWAILLLVFILGVVVVSTTISLEMVTRRRDIGLMKSIGTLLDTIFDFFMAQSVIILLASIVLGLTFGTILYMVGMMWLGSVVQGLQFTNSFPVIQLSVLAIVLVIAGYFSAQKPIYDTVQESPSVALNPDVGTKVRVSGFLDSFGLSFRIATKGTGRRIRGTRRTVLSLFLSFTIASLLWIGGGVVQTTSSAYVTRSMGTNVIAIGNTALLDSYYDAYSLYGTPLNDSFTFLDGADMMPTQLVADLEDTPGVSRVESRLVVYSEVEEMPAIIWNEEFEQYERIGLDRISSAVLVGLDWDTTISDWYFEGRSIDQTGQVWIGGKMASDFFEDPLVQRLGVQGSSLEIKAQAFDILNGGMMAIMDLSQLQSYYGVSGTNLALVQLEEYDDSLISQIEALAESYGFDIFRQQEVLESNLEAIAAIWALLNPLAIVTLLSAFLSLMNYLLVSVFGRLRDYIIMRSVGAKPSFLAKVMIAEGLDVGLRAGIPAIVVATLLSIYSLIPEAAVSSLAYLPLSIIAVLGTMIAVILLASIPTYVFFATRNDLRVSEFSS